MAHHEKLNYVEFPAKDIPATKRFFKQAFGWEFEDFGPDYTAFSDQGLDGGFYKSDLSSSSKNGAALLVLLSQNLEETQAKVEAASAKISQPIFSFPGGRRFHFIEPSDNEFAVWQLENSHDAAK
ncbi:MAG: glyoxalase [Gammaproteobacteria bacterium]|nr:MAG: glyoxalase [Gammaproteobacteria bacterium]